MCERTEIEIMFTWYTHSLESNLAEKEWSLIFTIRISDTGPQPGLLPNHKQSVLLFLDRVYGIDSQVWYSHRKCQYLSWSHTLFFCNSLVGRLAEQKSQQSSKLFAGNAVRSSRKLFPSRSASSDDDGLRSCYLYFFFFEKESSTHQSIESLQKK